MTIFCVKFLLLVVISKNVTSFAKHPRNFCNFKVYGSTLRGDVSLGLFIFIYKFLHLRCLREAVEYCRKTLNLRCVGGLCYVYGAPDMHA